MNRINAFAAIPPLAIAGMALTPSAASAFPIFDFFMLVRDYNGGPGVLQSSGRLTCAEELDANHSCVVNVMIGTVMNPYFFDSTPVAITNLSSYNGATNRIYYLTDEFHPFHADFDFGGLSFTTASYNDPFGISINVFSRGLDNEGRLRINERDNFFDGEPGKLGQSAFFSLTAVNSVPEPATWALLIVGFGLVGFSLRRSPSLLAKQQVAAARH